LPSFAESRVERSSCSTFDLDALPRWQQEYLHEGLAIERTRFPSLDDDTGRGVNFDRATGSTFNRP
jgi:hypothetical protein